MHTVWGTPDPVNAAESAYEFSAPAAAWQFLRRSPDYRGCWTEYARFGLWMQVPPTVDHATPPFISQIAPMIGVSAVCERVGLPAPPEPGPLQLEANQVAVVYDLTLS